MDRRLVVVARNQVPLCGYLRQQFSGDSDVEVILDRRRWERRRQIQACEPERRRADRRRKPIRKEDLHAHGFAIIRRQPHVVDLREIEKLIGELQNQIGADPPAEAITGIRGEPSTPSRSTEGAGTLESGGPSNGNSAWKGTPAGGAKRPVPAAAPLSPRTNSFGPDREKWQESLRKVGIEGLRLPENGALCAPWLKFLNDLNAGT